MNNRPADPGIPTSTPKSTTTRKKTSAATSSPSTRTTRSSVNQDTASAADKAKREASSAAQTAKRKATEVASSVAETAKSRAARLSSAVESEAEGVVDSAISRVHSTVDAGKHEASGYVGAIGRAFDAASDSLESDGLRFPATYVRAAANGLNQAAEEVDGFNTSSVTANVERYVRGNPMLAVAGLALAGFALANIIGGSKRR